MSRIGSHVSRWLPALGVMVFIFAFSSIPSDRMLHFGMLDLLVRKGAHMLGYGLLTLAYWYGLRFEKRLWWLPLLLAVLYAATDEFHQTFVPGRHPSPLDVGIDAVGASIALGFIYRRRFR